VVSSHFLQDAPEPPGSDAVQVIVPFTDDLSSASVDQLRHWVRSLRRAQSRLDGHAFKVRAELARRQSVDASVDLPDILRSDGGLTGRQAAKQADIAGRADALQECGAQLAAGDLTRSHFEQLARAQQLEPDAFSADETALTEAAQTLAPDQFARHVSHWVSSQATDDGSDRFNRQRQKRFLTISELDSGMIGVRGELDPEAGAKLQTVLGQVSDDLWRAESEGRRPRSSSAQRLADALIETVLQRVPAVLNGSGEQGRPVLHIALDYDTLRSQVDAAHRDPASSTKSGPSDTDCCSLPSASDRKLRQSAGRRAGTGSGLGTTTTGAPLSPATVRRLACDAEVIPTVLSAEGMVLDQGRRRRTATATQRSALILRDGHCVFPGCDRPPSWCQVHHLKPWHQGGSSNLDNLALICSAHHHLVHEGGWVLTPVGPNSWTARPPGRPRPRRGRNAA